MHQSFFYREVRYEVGPEIRGAREWAIFPDGSPSGGGARGVASVADNQGTARGSFKRAAMAAQSAIDLWLDDGQRRAG